MSKPSPTSPAEPPISSEPPAPGRLSLIDLKQRVAGVFLLLFSGVMLVWSWNRVLTRGDVPLQAALLFPAFAVIGLGMLLFPRSREARRVSEGGSQLRVRLRISPRWWAVLGLACAASALNYALLRGLA